MQPNNIVSLRWALTMVEFFNNSFIVFAGEEQKTKIILVQRDAWASAGF